MHLDRYARASGLSPRLWPTNTGGIDCGRLATSKAVRLCGQRGGSNSRWWRPTLVQAIARTTGCCWIVCGRLGLTGFGAISGSADLREERLIAGTFGSALGGLSGRHANIVTCGGVAGGAFANGGGPIDAVPSAGWRQRPGSEKA